MSSEATLVNAGEQHQAFNEALSFEANERKAKDDLISLLKKVLTLICIVAALEAVALVVLAPFKRPQGYPVLVGVDKAAGTTEVLEAVRDRDLVKYQELLDKHWATKYVIARESYNYRLLQADYDSVLLLSADDVGRDYARLYEGDNARDKKYGNSLEMKVNILSVSLSHDGSGDKAVVRFEKVVKRKDADQSDPPQYFVATLSYEYKPAMLGKESDLIQNPLGYKVTGWRVDSELAPVKGKV